MHSQGLPLLSLALITRATPIPLPPSQADTPSAYTSAAAALINSYIPPSALSILSASAASAASAASITGNPVSLLYSALEAPSPLAPWLASAVPTAYSAAISELTVAIAGLAPVTTGGGGSLTPTTGARETGSVVATGSSPTSGGGGGGSGSSSSGTSVSLTKGVGSATGTVVATPTSGADAAAAVAWPAGFAAGAVGLVGLAAAL